MTQDDVFGAFAYPEKDINDLDYLYEILFKADVDVFESVLSGQDAEIMEATSDLEGTGVAIKTGRDRSKRSSENVPQKKLAEFLS